MTTLEALQAELDRVSESLTTRLDQVNERLSRRMSVDDIVRQRRIDPRWDHAYQMYLKSDVVWRQTESVPTGPDSGPSQDTAGAENDAQRASGTVPLLAIHQQRQRVAAELARTRSVDAVLHQSPTTTPSFEDTRPRGDVPGLRPNPGMLRALLQPNIFLKLEEPVGAFEVGDVVVAQFWGEGRVMLTPLPAAAAKGRIPTTFPANKIHAVIAGPVAPHYDGPAEGTDAYDALHPLG